jgi:hypothetical protein
MPSQGWVQTLINSQVDGAAVTTNGADTSMLPPASLYTLPANSLAIGSILRIKQWGRISNIVTTPGTLTLTVFFGAVKVFTSSAMQLNAVAKTNVSFFTEIMLTCRAIGNGTNANFMGMGIWSSESVVGSPVPATGGCGQFMMPTVTPIVGTGFDSTVTQQIDCRANFSLTGNSLTCHQYILESLN